MPAEIELNLTRNYRSTLKDLKESLITELGKSLSSIILYGSIARGDFSKESDIDLLLILKNKYVNEKAYEAGYNVDVKNNTVTSLLVYSSDEISKLLALGSPFIKNVVAEGKTIYDDGTWDRLRNSPVGAGR
jgi:uncharacterized protein